MRYFSGDLHLARNMLVTAAGDEAVDLVHSLCRLDSLVEAM